MSKKPLLIAILVLIIAIAGVLGYYYTKEAPQVSKDDSKEILTKYKEDLQERYKELNSTYDSLAAAVNTAEWESFSSTWIPKLSEARPDNISKRFPSGYDTKRDVLVAAQGAILSLWSEYNKTFIGKEADLEQVKDLKIRIEQTFESLKI